MALKDMMNMMLGIKEMQQRQQQIDLQRQQQEGSAAQQALQNKTFAVQQLQSMLPTIRNPKQVNKIIGFLSDNFDVSRETLQEQADQYLASTQQQQAQLSADAVTRAQGGGQIAGETEQYRQLSNATGSATLAGTDPGNMGMSAMIAGMVPTIDQIPLDQRQAFSTRAVTGMSQGEFAIDKAKAGMSPEEIQQGARVQMGLAPSADNLLQARIQQQAQALQRELGFANIDQAYDQLAQQYQLEMMSLIQKGDIAGAEAARASLQATLETANVIKGTVELAGKPQTGAMRDVLSEILKNTVPMLPTMQQEQRRQQTTNPVFPGQTKPPDYKDQRSWGRWWQP